MRFYAGAPLVRREGLALGTLCVMDRKQRDRAAFQIEALGALSRQVSHLIELRRVSRALDMQLREREWYEQQLRGLLADGWRRRTRTWQSRPAPIR